MKTYKSELRKLSLKEEKTEYKKAKITTANLIIKLKIT